MLRIEPVAASAAGQSAFAGDKVSGITLKQRLRYRFDNFMSRGGTSIFISLTVIFFALLLLVFVVRVALYAMFPEEASQHPSDPFTNLYITWLEMTDPGNMAQDISSSGVFKIPAVLAGVFGIVLLSALIAFITTELDQKLKALKKGHSKVVEEGHTLILGWDDRRILEVLRELIEANESEDDPCVVILSSKDKEFMDDYIQSYLKYRGNTRIVTRSGEEAALADLEVVSAQTCKSCIVLAACPESAGEEDRFYSDAKVIKAIMAMSSAMAEAGDDFNIAAEIYDQKYRSVAEQISHGNVIVIDSSEVLSKILVQTSRSIGLSVVYNEILSFEGAEMYLYEDDWRGETFGNAVYHFEDGVPVGVRSGAGNLTINPPADRVLGDDDELLIIATDDSALGFAENRLIEPRVFTLPDRRHGQRVERELIIGWSSRVELILAEYTDYLIEGSAIDIAPRAITEEIKEQFDVLAAQFPHVTLSLLDIDPNDEQDLVSLDLPKYDNIIILSRNVGEGDEELADSETILQLLMLRNILERDCEGEMPKLITEILNSSNLELVSRTGVNDFIISDRLVSMMLAQISENKVMKEVYDDLFSEDGSEIYLKSAGLYFDQLPVSVRFADMIGIAQQREEVCFGVKIKAREGEIDENFGITLNPPKDTVFTLTEDDTLIVISEDET